MPARHESAYLSVVGEPRMMKGKGAPRSTVFGVLGRTVETGYTKSLGGLVHQTVSGKVPAHMSEKKAMKEVGQTEYSILGPASKTHYPGAHYGQVPYPGAFSSHLGAMMH